MRTNKEILEGTHAAWFDGYFLNNAEFRISLALHCLLKACYPCNRKHENGRLGVPKLINKICINEPIDKYPKECEGDNKKCNQIPISLNGECKEILTDFFYYEKKRKYDGTLSPEKTGHYLVEVHFRVNTLKRTLNPED